MRTLCNESKNNLRTPLGKWSLDENIYITSWQWFLSRDLHALYYREHETWCKYIQFPNRAHRRIELQIDTKSKTPRPSRFQVYRISLITRTHTDLGVEATIKDSPPEPSGPPLDSAKEEVVYESKLRTSFKKTEHRHKFLVSHLTFSDKLDVLYSEFMSGEARARRDGSYRSGVGIISAVWIIKYKCGTQYTQ